MSSPQTTVLVVEDDESQRRALSAFLAGEGLRVCSASSGAGAVRMLTSECPDIVLLDVDLGEDAVDGTTIAAMMSRDPEWCKIPVIITSGLDPAEIRKRASGEYAFAGVQKSIIMNKPVDLALLLENVRRMLAPSEPG